MQKQFDFMMPRKSKKDLRKKATLKALPVLGIFCIFGFIYNPSDDSQSQYIEYQEGVYVKAPIVMKINGVYVLKSDMETTIKEIVPGEKK